MNPFKVMALVAIIVAMVSCNKNADKSIESPGTSTISMQEMISESGANADELVIKEMTSANADVLNRKQKVHFVYTESNEAGSNRILAYEIQPDGNLDFKGATASGGAGTGAGLGSQGALVIDKHHEWLFAVNAGSNTVSSFKIRNDGSLKLVCTKGTEGMNPNSVTVHGDLLYVLNHGSDNIHGFKIGSNGSLTHIQGSTQSLSGAATDAPQISFTPDGDWLVVTEKATNNINSFKVKGDGAAWPAVVTASTGQTPFGFDFARDKVMVVSNAAGGAAGAGSATSYHIRSNGNQQAINGAIANQQGAPCWVAVTEFGRFAFITNTGSNSISSYYIGPGGRLYLVDKAAAGTDNKPTDIVVADNNYFVYALTANSGTIGEFHRTFWGGLKKSGSAMGLPSSTTGLATF